MLLQHFFPEVFVCNNASGLGCLLASAAAAPNDGALLQSADAWVPGQQSKSNVWSQQVSQPYCASLYLAAPHCRICASGTDLRQA